MQYYFSMKNYIFYEQIISMNNMTTYMINILDKYYVVIYFLNFASMPFYHVIIVMRSIEIRVSTTVQAYNNLFIVKIFYGCISIYHRTNCNETLYMIAALLKKLYKRLICHIDLWFQIILWSQYWVFWKCFSVKFHKI